jgi:hypothetical protein
VAHGTLPGGEALAAKLPGAAVGPDDRALSVTLPPEAWHVFDAETGRRLEPA